MSAAAGTGQLTVEKLEKSYPVADGTLTVLRGIDLALAAGDELAIMGPSGSGKSTLLHILGGLDCPTSGTVRVNGQNPHQLAEPELAKFRNETIGFVFQDHYLLPQCTVLENVLIPVLASGRGPADTAERARELIERVGLADRQGHRPAELSGGERQRVALARALLLRPPVVLGDEPTGNLDRGSAERVAELLLELARDQRAILIVATHSSDLAGRLARRARLADGKLDDA